MTIRTCHKESTERLNLNLNLNHTVNVAFHCQHSQHSRYCSQKTYKKISLKFCGVAENLYFCILVICIAKVILFYKSGC